MLETLAAKIGFGLLFGKMKKAQIPKWVWLLVAGILIAVGGFWYHSHKVSVFETNTRTDQKRLDDDAHQKELAKAHQDALDWKAKYVSASSNISNQGKIDHAISIDRNATLARSLSAHGSGKADLGLVCSSSPIACSSGHQSGSGSTIDAQVGGVPNSERSNLIAVPRDDLIKFAQHYDDNTDEVKTWRVDKVQQLNLYNSLLTDELSGK